MKKKIIRITTVPTSLNTFCRGLLRELSEDYDVVAVSSPGEELQELAQREGVRAVAVQMERHISPWKDLQSLIRLIRVFRSERPYMVHSMTPKAGLLSMMAAWIAKVPVRVHTFTGLVFPTAKGFQRRLLMMTDRITCFCATHVVPEGEGVKHDLQHFGITGKPMEVLGYGNVRGIDLDFYDRTPKVMAEADGLRASLELSHDAFVFVFIGRLVGDKGINELVLAFERLQKEHVNAHLILVGREEPELDPLSAETRTKLGLCPNIHAVGQKQDVRPWYACANALVFPSYREGFPNVVIEAGAMGLPCIVTDINGSREIIRNGENGVIIPPRSEQDLYKAMSDFVCNQDNVRKLSAKARTMVAERYGQSYVRQCLKAYYISLN